MKKLLLIASVLFLVFSYTPESKANYFNNGYGIFYTSLSPHGMWIQLDDGLVVWRPTIMRRGWAPYKYGQWLWTSDGWYWDSHEPFGYITYHYGRWFYDDYYGWIWLPDYEWAPAWVEWRYDDNYIGWAPLPPYAVFSINIGIHFTHDYHTPYHHWHFVKYRRFCDPYVYNHYAGAKYKYRIYERSHYNTNYGYNNGRVVNRGVDIGYVRNRTGQNIREREITRSSDYRDFERDNRKDNNRSNERIRTFVVSREDLIKNDAREVEIKRSDRRSSLETSKIELGGRYKAERSRDLKNLTDENTGNETRQILKSREMEENRKTNRDEKVIGNEQPEVKRNIQERKTNENETPVIRRNESQQVNRQAENKRLEQKIETRRTETPENKVTQPRIERKSESPKKENPTQTITQNERERKPEVRQNENKEPVKRNENQKPAGNDRKDRKR